jgi:hypothetical protein
MFRSRNCDSKPNLRRAAQWQASRGDVRAGATGPGGGGSGEPRAVAAGKPGAGGSRGGGGALYVCACVCCVCVRPGGRAGNGR